MYLTVLCCPPGREVVTVTHNVEQAEQTRDAVSKALYSRLFDFLVEVGGLKSGKMRDISRVRYKVPKNYAEWGGKFPRNMWKSCIFSWNYLKISALGDVLSYSALLGSRLFLGQCR